MLGDTGARLILGAAVLVVEELVAGTPWAAAVGRVIGHRWCSWFCVVRMDRFCLGGRAKRRAGVRIGVDDGTRTILAGVQTLGLLKPDNDRTIRLPLLILNVSRQMPGERIRGEFAIGVELLVVAFTQGDDVVIRCQVPIAGQALQPI